MALTLNNLVGFETGGLEEASGTAGLPDATEATTVRSGIRSLKLLNTGFHRYYIAPFESVADAGDDQLVGFAVRFSALGGSGVVAFFRTLEEGTQLWVLELEADGDLVYTPIAGGAVTVTSPFTVDTWHFIEIRWQHLDAGAFDLCIDGVPKISVTERDMAAAGTFDAYQLQNSGDGPATTFFDDFYCSSGASGVGDFLGDAEVFGYQANTNSATPDTGDDLDYGDPNALWQEVGTTPGDADEIGYEGTPLTGAVYTDDTESGEHYRHGPHGDANIDGTIKGAKFLHQLYRGGGGGTVHYVRCGNDGDGLTDVVVEPTTAYVSYMTVSELATVVPLATEHFALGFRVVGAQNLYCKGMWAMLLHVPSTGSQFDKQVAHGNDDAEEDASGGAFSSTTVYLRVHAHTVATGRFNVGFRFTGVTIPQGKTVLAATLEVYQGGSLYDDPNCEIFCEDVDNAADFVTTADVTDRVTTDAAVVEWDALNIGVAAWKTSPDFKAHVEEILARPGWASGQALVVLLKGKSDKAQYLAVRTYDYGDGSLAAKLHITFEQVMRSVAGSQPAATGALSRIRRVSRAVAGSQPAASGALTRRYLRSVVGSQPAATGSLVVASLYRALSHDNDGEHFTGFSGGVPTPAHAYDTDMPWHDIGKYLPVETGSRVESHYRFPSVSVPSLAYIAEAYLIFICRGDSGCSGQAQIGGDDQDDATDIADLDHADFHASSRPRTTAQVNWVPGSYNVDDIITLPDISSLLREIVERPGWSSGNAVAIFIDNTCVADEGRLEVEAAGEGYEENTLNPDRPTLRILWGPARSISGSQPAATGVLVRVRQAIRSTVGIQPSATGTLNYTIQKLRSVTGVQPAAAGILTRSHHQARAPPGVQPAATGILARVQGRLRSLTGIQPASSGALSRTRIVLRSVAGTQPSATGTLLRVEIAIRSVSGTQPAATAALSRIYQRVRTPSGVQPASVGALSRIEQAIRALSGVQPSSAGTLARIEQAVRSLSGVQPAYTGALARIQVFQRSPVGVQPSAAGILSSQRAVVRSVTGLQPAPTGALTRQGILFRALVGTQPTATAILSRILQALRVLSGVQPSATGILDSTYLLSVSGVQPSASGTLARVEQAVRSPGGVQPAATATVTLIKVTPRSVAGAQPSSIGTLSRIEQAVRSLSGTQPSASGTVVPVLGVIPRSVSGTQPSSSGALSYSQQLFRVLAGVQPASSAALSRTFTTFRVLTGTQPAATAILTRLLAAAHTLLGTQPFATGALSRLKAAPRSLAGVQPASTATLSRVEQAIRSLVGTQPSAMSVLARIEQAVRTLAGVQPSATGALSRAITSLSSPTSFDAFNPTQNTIDLTWVKGAGATHTLIRRKVGSYPTDRTDGDSVYLSDGVSYQDTELSPGIAYYYRAWGARLED